MNLAPRPFATATLAVSLAHSRHGTPRPTLEVRFPRHASHRQVSAALHLLAAAAEMATPTREGWCVQTEQPGDTMGFVYLELVEARDDEAQRGMALLSTVRQQALAS